MVPSSASRGVPNPRMESVPDSGASFCGFLFTTVGALRPSILEGFGSVFFDSIGARLNRINSDRSGAPLSGNCGQRGLTESKSVHRPFGPNPLTAFFIARFCLQHSDSGGTSDHLSDGDHPEPVWSVEHAATGFSRAYTPTARDSRRQFALHYRPGGIPAWPQLGLSAYHTLRLHVFRSGGGPLHISRGRVSRRVDRLLPGLEVSDPLLQADRRDSTVAITWVQIGGIMTNPSSGNVSISSHEQHWPTGIAALALGT